MKNVKHIFIALSMVALLGAVSCKKFDPWGGEPGGGTTGSTTSTTGSGNTNCTLKGKLVSVPCGISDFDNLWIQTEDGKYYQPCDASIIHRSDYSVPLVDGTPITFGFEPMEKGCLDEGLILCPNKLPAKIKIRLTCLNPIFTVILNTCTPITRVNQINNKRGFAEIINAKRDGNCIRMHVRYSSAKPLDCKNFTLTWDGSLMKPKPAIATLYLDNLPSGIDSQVIQEGDIAFDISPIVEAGGNDVKIKIDGYNDWL